ncbi:MAG: inositol monophosphatase family protein [Anaerolineales bacterium]
MNEYQEWLDVIEEIARDAGALLKARWNTSYEIRSKGYRNIVTEIDLAAEALILGRLREHFPDHAITSEEAGADAHRRAVRWLVDPLDGTTNFSRHNPNFSVSIAASEGIEPVVGVVYDPLRDQAFTARRGAGAALNGEPLQSSGNRDLGQALVSADWPREPALRRELWAIMSRLIHEVRTLRCLGSAALNMVYVAAGWFDLYVARQISAWDQTAAALILREAGGALGTLSGAPWTPDSPDPVAAATPELLKAFQALLAGGG